MTVCWLMGPEVLPGLPEMAPPHELPFVPFPVHVET
jgi:hypothetical protein